MTHFTISHIFTDSIACLFPLIYDFSTLITPLLHDGVPSECSNQLDPTTSASLAPLDTADLSIDQQSNMPNSNLALNSPHKNEKAMQSDSFELKVSTSSSLQSTDSSGINPYFQGITVTT